MNMKSVLGLVLAAGLLSAGLANASELKIGIVDVKSAFENTKAYQQGQNKLKALVSRKEKELNALQAKIEQAEKDMMGQRMVMSPERLAEKDSDIKEMRKLYSRMQQDAQDEIVSEESKLQGTLGMKFRDVLEKFGKDSGYDLILPKAQQIVLYANPAHDVTGEITKLLDK
jgi:outer membrane protein